MKTKKVTGAKILIYVLLGLGMIVAILPMLYMISTSLKPNGALYEYPPRFLPNLDEITAKNYVYILRASFGKTEP